MTSDLMTIDAALAALPLKIGERRFRSTAYRIALANALGFIKAHAIGNSTDGLAVRRQIAKTLRRAA